MAGAQEGHIGNQAPVPAHVGKRSTVDRGITRAERARGRRLVLATAAPRRVADAVARHLGLFEAVIASDHTRHQAGAAKLTAIREAVRGGAFDYMGDKRADLPLFRAARLAILVHPSKHLLTRARASCWVGRVFD
jgi:phosphoserine phosphatase